MLRCEAEGSYGRSAFGPSPIRTMASEVLARMPDGEPTWR